MSKKASPLGVRQLLHNDIEVTPARIAEFDRASHAEQLHVLAILRARAVDSSTNHELAVTGIAFAAVALGVTLTPGLLPKIALPAAAGAPLWMTTIVFAIWGMGAALALAPTFIQALRSSDRQSKAAVWLAAYEDPSSRRGPQPSRRKRAGRRLAGSRT